MLAHIHGDLSMAGFWIGLGIAFHGYALMYFGKGR